MKKNILKIVLLIFIFMLQTGCKEELFNKIVDNITDKEKANIIVINQYITASVKEKIVIDYISTNEVFFLIEEDEYLKQGINENEFIAKKVTIGEKTTRIKVFDKEKTTECFVYIKIIADKVSSISLFDKDEKQVSLNNLLLGSVYEIKFFDYDYNEVIKEFECSYDEEYIQIVDQQITIVGVGNFTIKIKSKYTDEVWEINCTSHFIDKTISQSINQKTITKTQLSNINKIIINDFEEISFIDLKYLNNLEKIFINNKNNKFKLNDIEELNKLNIKVYVLKDKYKLYKDYINEDKLLLGSNEEYLNNELCLMYEYKTDNDVMVDYLVVSKNSVFKKDLFNIQNIPGYVFSGFECANGDILENSIINTDMFLKAKYIPKEYKITFNYDGGEGNTDTLLVKYQDKIINLPTSTKAGYSFDGWVESITNNKVSNNDEYLYTEDILVYAFWKPCEYEITFDFNDNETINKTVKIKTDDKYSLLDVEQMVKENGSMYGFTFAGWFYNNRMITEQITFNEAKNITLKARWYKEFSLSENANKVKIYFNENISNLPKPVKTDDYGEYKFKGWFFDEDKTIECKDTDILDDKNYTNLYAKWNSLVRFNQENGLEVKEIEVEKDERYTLLDNISNGDCVFKGWFSEKAGLGEIIDSNSIADKSVINLYAKWEIKISFDSLGGVLENNELIYTKDTCFGTLPNVEKNDCIFKGWFYNDEIITTDTIVEFTNSVTLKAKWEVIVTLHYNYLDNTLNNELIEKVSVIYDEEYEFITPTKDGNTFKGWSSNDDEYSLLNGKVKISFNKNIDLYAQWLCKIFLYKNISDYNNSKILKTLDVVYKQEIKGLFDPTQASDSMTFINWTKLYTDIEYKENDIYLEHNEICLIGNWKTSIKLDYQDHQPNNAILASNIEYGDVVKLPVLLEVDGARFAGWWTKPFGEGTEYINNETKYESLENITLYAKWIIVLKLDLQNGYTNGKKELEVIYGKTIPDSALPDSTNTNNKVWKDTNVFCGWYTDIGGKGNKIENGSLVDFTSSCTLYAKWQCLITFYKSKEDANKGINYETIKEVIYNSSLSEVLYTTTSSDLSFIGWFEDINGEDVLVDENGKYLKDTNSVYYAKFNVKISLDYQNATHGDIDYLLIEKGKSLVGLPDNNDISKENYEFLGWFSEIGGNGTKYLSNSIIKAENNFTLYACWRIHLQFLTEKYSGINCPNIYGTKIELPYNDPVKSNCTFKGWFSEAGGKGIQITSDLILDDSINMINYAAWETTLTFDYNGATGGNGIQNKNVFIDGLYNELPNPEKTSCYFLGWYDDNGKKIFENDIYKINGPSTVHARWGLKIYVDPQGGIFENNEGLYLEELTNRYYFECENSVINYLPTVSKDGNDFGGWYTDIGGKGEQITISMVKNQENLCLYAKWTTTLYYNGQLLNPDGTTMKTNPAAITVTYNNKIPKLLNPKLTGGMFLGWYTGIAGTGKKINENDLFIDEKGYTIYACWDILVKFYDYDNTYLGQDYYRFNSPITKFPTIEENGFKLLGYGIYKNNKYTLIESGTIFNYSESLILYAVKQITVTYGNKTKKCIQGEAIGLLESDYVPGIIHVCWRDDYGKEYNQDTIIYRGTDFTIYEVTRIDGQIITNK